MQAKIVGPVRRTAAMIAGIAICGAPSAMAAAGETYDLVCQMSGKAGFDTAQPVTFERIYSVDFTQMKACDRQGKDCGFVAGFTASGDIVALGDPPSVRGTDFFQADYNVTTGKLVEVLSVAGKIVSDVAGSCERRAFTPLPKE